MATFDFEQPINMEEMRKYRLERMDEQMNNDDLDCIITMRVDNVRYLTSFRPNSPNLFYYFRYAAVKAVGDTPWALVASGDYDRAKTYMPWLQGKVKPLPMDPMLSVERFKEIFKELGLRKGAKIGIDEMGFQLFEVFKDTFSDYEFVDARATFSKAKAIKSAAEIYLIKKACAIAEAGTQVAIENLRPGLTEIEVSAMIHDEMILRGSEGGHTHPTQVNSGENAETLVRFPTERIIRNGDFVLMDVGCCYNGYHSDYCRTVMAGKPVSNEQKKVYTAVYDATMAALEACKPGAYTSDIDKASRDVLRRAGYEKYWYFGVTGHATGTSLQEAPIIGEASAQGEKPWVIEPGMVFCMEPSVHLPGVGGVRIEDMVAITEDGFELLTQTEYENRLLLK
ncbi:aminopeptidase P family protein [Virgibacillus sp. NKC19-3]|uniref:M24 family metallopeptidase n=1 Tax=Virgibacillus saliphilus TaxID=2831674 RepID=UPI001C9B3AF7|nr:Xaa-Pro peptidase family protein [Virgibacillus sp. NKC19-3]MBY7144456.1 aminopeptidase P family protein [Virgibacillus sp. NKC19-3]